MLRWTHAFSLGVLLLLAGCTPTGGGPLGSRAGGPGAPSQYTSNGQRIYFTATSDSGESITSEGGPGGGMMMQARLACASCHGPDGHGGQVTMMMRTFQAPNITWSDLSEPDHAGAEMDHPPYIEESLKRAIMQGLDPAGKPLEWPMPRWQMSERDLDDLVAYLKTLR